MKYSCKYYLNNVALFACYTIFLFVLSGCNYNRIGIDSVRKFYLVLAEAEMSPAGLEKLSTLQCNLVESPRALFGVSGFDCEVETVCNFSISQPFFYSVFQGASFGPDKFAERFARRCPGMLNDRALKKISVDLDRGG